MLRTYLWPALAVAVVALSGCGGGDSSKSASNGDGGGGWGGLGKNDASSQTGAPSSGNAAPSGSPVAGGAGAAPGSSGADSGMSAGAPGADLTMSAGAPGAAGADPAMGAGAGADPAMGAGAGADPTIAGAGADPAMGAGAGADPAMGAGAGADPTMIAGAGADPAMGAGAGADLAMGAGAGADLAMGAGTGTMIAGAGADPAMGAGAGADPAMIGGAGADPAMIGGAPGAGIGTAGMSTAGVGMVGGAEMGGVARLPAPTTLREHSLQKFGQGANKEGYQLLHAHNLTDNETRVNYRSMAWSPYFVRPAQAVTWAVGVHSEGKIEIADVKSPGSIQDLPTRTKSRIRDAGAGAPIDATLDSTGVGVGLAGGPGAAMGADPAMGGIGGMGDMGSMGGGGGNSRGIPPEFAKWTGETGNKFIDQLRERVKDGRFGEFLRSTPGAREQQKYLPAGVMILNEGQPADSLNDLLAKARENGADVLAVFQVKVSQSRRSPLITNNTTIELLDVATGKPLPLGKSPTLNNIKVQQFRQDEKKGDDPIDEAIAKLMEMVDKSLSLVPVPAGLQAEHVRQRVGSLLQLGDQGDLLRRLDEINYYSARQLLPPAHLLIAYQRLLGDGRAEIMASGETSRKFEILKPMLPADARLPGAAAKGAVGAGAGAAGAGNAGGAVARAPNG